MTSFGVGDGPKPSPITQSTKKELLVPHYNCARCLGYGIVSVLLGDFSTTLAAFTVVKHVHCLLNVEIK